MMWDIYNIQTEEYKTATTCGILVKNIFDKDYGNWRWEDNLQIPWRHNLVSCEVKTSGGWINGTKLSTNVICRILKQI